MTRVFVYCEKWRCVRPGSCPILHCVANGTSLVRLFNYNNFSISSIFTNDFMKQLFIFIAILAAACVGYIAYQHFSHPELDASASTENPNFPGSLNSGRPFEPKIVLPPRTDPDQKRLCPPGIFYMLNRVSKETKDGVYAIRPGEQVKLLKRLAGGKLRLTDGKAEIEVMETLTTNDLDIAQEAEIKDYTIFHGQR